jgi:AraC-like DNA-binding protein
LNYGSTNDVYRLATAGASMPKTGHFHCVLCDHQTSILTVKEAAKKVGVCDQTMYVWVRQKKVHVMRTASGQIRICYRSLLLSEQSAQEPPRVALVDVRIKLAMRVLDEQYSYAEPTLGKLSKQLGISMWHFAKLFKKNTGVCFKEYIKDLRMKKAAELLRNTFLSIKEISISIGYKHVSDFDHQFKAVYGVQPSAYRRAHLEVGEDHQARNPKE